MKKKKRPDDPERPPLEKHPLEKLPVKPEEQTISEEDLDTIPDEEEEETTPYVAPPAGEGP